MTRAPAPNTFARRLLVIAVTEYDDGSPAEQMEFSAGISAQVATVEGWWADPDLDDRRRFTATYPKQLRTLRDLREFLLSEELDDLDDDEALVVYITGHGLAPANARQHFLRLPSSYEDRPLSTAFPTAELITTVLDSHATHVLVMVDSCFSGQLEDQLKANLKALREERRALGSLVVLTAGNEESRPRLGQFTNLLRAAHDHCADEANGYAEPHLSWQDWSDVVDRVFDDNTMANLHTIWPTPSAKVQRAQQQLSPCLPNPGYTGTEPVLDASLSQVGWTRTELDKYWISRAAGETASGASGWYFTGRTELVKRMLTFLGGNEGVLVVTGEAGSGKSALLARMVTLSDARFRSDPHYGPLIAAIPKALDVRQGSVDAAVLARNSDPDDLAEALYDALGGAPGRKTEVSAKIQDAGPLARLREFVRDTARQRGEALTIVVDGIDEARNPTRVITDLIRPLTDLRIEGEKKPAVRLLLGIRSPRQNTPTTADTTPTSPSGLLGLLLRATHSTALIRTDDAEATSVDVAAYVRALLQAPRAGQDDPWSQPDPARHRDLAEVVAQEVSPSFLDARIAAERLRSMQDLPGADDSMWRQTLRQGTEALLREDLGEVALWCATPTEHLMTALRASAFAQGAGLPWADIWPTALEAMSASLVHNSDEVIRQVMDSRLNGYLTTAVEDGRTVYRPIHERISETLRYAPHSLLHAPEADRPERLPTEEITAVHGQLTKAFRELLPAAAGQAPHPYLRRHLITHAAVAGLVDDHHVPMRFLPWETSGTVRAALGLPADPGEHALNLASWARIEHFLDDAGVSARADSLALSILGMSLARGSVQPGFDDRQHHGYGAGFTPRWNHLWVPGNLLGRTSADLSSLVSFTLPDGNPLVAAGDQDGEVRVWDPLTGTEFGLPFRRAPQARALAVLSKPGAEPLLAVGTAQGVWTYDPQSGDAHHLPMVEAVFALAVFTTRGGRVRLAIGTAKGLFVCDPLTGAMVSHPPEGGSGFAIKALATQRLSSGRTLLAVGGDGSTLDVLDAESLEVVTEVTGQGRGVSALALYFDLRGRPRLAAASRTTRSVRNYDALTGEENPAARIQQSVASIGLYPHPNRWTLLALGGGDGGPVSLWDPGTGEELYVSPTDHTKRVKAVAAVVTEGQMPLVLSGSLDRTVRVWRPTVLMPETERHQEELGSGSHMAVLPEAGHNFSLLGPARSGAVNVRSAATGQPRRQLSWPAEWNSVGLTALATHTWPDGSTSVIAGMGKGLIGRWDEENGWKALPLAQIWESTPVRSLATCTAEGGDQVVLISGTSGGSICFNDLATGEPWSDPLQESRSIRALATLSSATVPLVAFSTGADVRFSHLGEPPHLRLPGRIGFVSSLAVCPAEDGSSLLATGGSDGSIRLWSPDSPKKEAYPVLKGHRGQVSSIGLLQLPSSPQPFLATAGSQDTTVRLWNPWTGEELMRLVSGTSLTSLCVLPNGGVAKADDPAIVCGGPAGMAAGTVRC
ncbi:AAA family ATPase [Streptomyces sp. NPDC051577]|uniref:AAA family ATPase n=1 Tax=Streptomyces sp. NPDC051577 TaxID=3155166 RepID=UPI00342B9949